jgi:tight adherence protein B
LRRAVVACFVAAIAAAACASSFAADTVRLTSIGRLRFPDRGYLVDLPRHARLNASQVVVRENGRPVENLRVMPADESASAKVGVVLAIDASNSMRGRAYREALAAARTFADQTGSGELVGAIAFNRRTHVLVRPTGDAAALRAALEHPPALAEGTHIYDAVSDAAKLLDDADVASGVVVLLSDGTDTGSHAAESKVSGEAKAKHVRVFTVGLRSSDFSSGPLRRLAADTNASYSEAKSTSDLRGIYGGLGARLASEYLLAYHSTLPSRTHVHVTISIKGVGDGALSYTAGRAQGLGPYHRSLLERFWDSPVSMVFVGLAAMVLIGGAVALLMRRRPTTLVARLSAYLSLQQPVDEERKRPLLTERLLAGTEGSLSKTRWWAKFQEDLEIAGITIVPAQIVVATVFGTVVAAIVFGLLWPPLVIVAFAVPLCVRAVIHRKLKKVRDDFLEQLPDNLQVLASALRAGHSFTGALAVVAKDAPEPARREFQRVVADEQLGVPIESSLREVARRMDNDDVEQVALLAELQREAGGNMAEVLDTVVDTIRERFDLRRLVQTLTAQGRMARWILSLLPPGLALVITALNPHYMAPLLDSTGGRFVLLLAAAMVVTGSLVIKRIVDIKV